jgi:predicted phosphoribosyltransferase
MTRTVEFADRVAAGRALATRVAAHLRPYLDRSGPPLVLALPRGGVPVAAQVSVVVGGDLDVVVARKIGMPGHPEVGVGAVAEDEQPLFDQHQMAYLGLRPANLVDTVDREIVELRRRVRRYRGDRPPPSAAGRLVIVVDDGLATGVTARAALRALRKCGPARLSFAAPVCAADSADLLIGDADEVVCVARPEPFGAVGSWYADFSQTTDEEVVALLTRYRPAPRASGSWSTRWPVAAG